MRDNPGNSAFRLVALVFCVFVVIYFVFPSVLFRACELVLGPRSESGLLTLFAPITYLSDTIPLYDALLQKEAVLTGMAFRTLSQST